MKVAYFDTVGGISGDMTLGALVSAGVPFEHLTTELNKLHLHGFELHARHIQRNGITAVKVDVLVHDHTDHHKDHHHRHLKDIIEIIQKSDLNEKIQKTAVAIFTNLAKAEAAVHQSSIEKVHFHEVGAVDAIVDIVGTTICLDYLGIDAVYSSPVKTGSGGFVHTAHGMLPVPTPATVELLKGYEIELTNIPYELTTPTGAAIIATLSQGILKNNALHISSVGYGAGTREIDTIPNLLRVIIGVITESSESDRMLCIETNIDNMNPEIYPYVLERLFAAGAVDAYLTPIIMKKGRPAITLSVLVPVEQKEQICSILFRETNTLGVRMYIVERRKLVRTEKTTVTSLGEVRVKAILINGKEQLRPEFEECKRLAQQHQLPLIEVYKILQHELRS